MNSKQAMEFPNLNYKQKDEVNNKDNFFEDEFINEMKIKVINKYLFIRILFISDTANVIFQKKRLRNDFRLSFCIFRKNITRKNVICVKYCS